MSTWKKYGGIDKFDKTNHMTVDSMVTNYFTVRKQIIGDIDISGNLEVRTRLDVYDDASFNKDITVNGNVDIGDNLDVSGNITTNSNLTVKDNILVYHNLYFNSDRKVFMNGTPDGIGVNTTMPISQFDIVSDLESVFSVKTSQPTTENVIARNNADKGIVVKSDLSSATIDFFCDSSMVSITNAYDDLSGHPQLDVSLNYNNYDARIRATNDGSLTIDASANIQLLAQTMITDNKSSILDNNSSLSVYNDKTTNIYLEDAYGNTTSYVSDGISLVSVDASSSILMKMVSRSNDSISKGFAVVGGVFPGDTSRAMGSLGCLDVSGNYTPNQTIVSGNSNVKIKTTVGINKYVPETDTRVLDINGPTRINNGEITAVKNADFQCNFLSFCRDNVNCGISTGAPYNTFSDTSYQDQIYWGAKIYYTSDAGLNWNDASAKVYGTTTALPLNAGFVYDSSYAFVYGDAGVGFYTNDGGATWLNKSFNATSTNVKSMYVAKEVGNADCRVFMAYDGLTLRYYDAKIGSTSSSYVSYDGSSGSIVLTNQSGYTIYSQDLSGGINAVHGYSSYIYCAGSYIYKYDATSTITHDNYINKYNQSSKRYSYNTIYAYDDNYVVAAGENIISYTLNGGTDWNDIIFTTSAGNANGTTVLYSENQESFQSIHVYDYSNAIVVGANSSIYYTNNGTLWKKVPDNLLDAAGNRSICYGSSNALLNGVFCVNKNSFITTRIVEEYTDISNNGSSKIFYNYFPNLFNRSENIVLDMCGNMNIFGDINIQDNGNITSNGTTFHLVNNSVQNIYIGGDASSINIGYTSGSTTIHHDLYVDKDLTVVNGDLHVPNTAYINIADISGLQVYEDATIDNILTVGSRVIIDNSAQVTVDNSSNAPLYVAGGSYFGGNVIMSNSNGDSLLYVNGDTRIMGELYAMNTVHIESPTEYALQITSGNIYLNNNMDTLGNMQVMGNLISRNKTYLGGNTYITGNVVYENVEISYDNVTISDNYTYNPSIINFSVENWDNLQKPVDMATRAYVDASLNSKAPIASPVFTGIPSAPTPSLDVSSTQIATTAFVKNQYYLKTATAASTYAPINSPTFTGIPSAPTAETNDNTNKIATTGFVKNVINNIAESITLTGLDNTWSGNNTFNKDIYIHGARFGTMDGSSIVIGNSLASLSTGKNNIAIGQYNGNNITTGSNNTIMGYQSLYNNKSGGNNVAMGTSALYNNKDGSYNIAIGYNAGYSDSSGSCNTYIGSNTDSSGSYYYSTAIGYGAIITASNEIVLGTKNDFVYIPSTTASTSTNTGAVIVKGGVGIAGNIYVNRNADITGNTTIRSNVTSTSTSTGALIISNGGAGIAGNVHIGRNAYVYGNIYTTTASSNEDSSMVATTQFVKTKITNDQASNHSWTGTNSFSQNITVNDTIVGKYSNDNYVFGNTVMPSIENADYNIGVGKNTLYTNYSGSNNIAIGNNSMYDLYDNNYNTAIGHNTLTNIGGNNNTAIGYYAGTNHDVGTNNTYVGGNTTTSNGSYSYSTALGYGATINGNNQVVLGTADETVVIPGTQTSIDMNSGALVVSGGVGISGDVNVGGVIYLENDIDPSNNSNMLATTAFVKSTLSGVSFSTGGDYTWTGTNAFSQNITVNNMIIGKYGINNYSLGTKFQNIAFGLNNIGIGPYSMSNIAFGNDNIGIGASALYQNVIGSNNIGIGSATLQGNTNVNNNVAVGSQSLNITTGDNNVAIGHNSGTTNTTGQYNTFLGYRAKTSGTYSYSTAVGQNANITGNNQLVLGTSSEYVYIPGTTASTSSTTGALVVSGGVGIGGNVTVGGAIYLTNNIDPSDNSTMLATTSYVQSAVNSKSISTTGDYTWTGTNTWTGTPIFTEAIQAQSDITMTGNINNVEIKYFGNSNFKLGQYSLNSITSGFQNTAVGYNVLGRCSTGHENTALGLEALVNCTTGSYNTAMGLHSLQDCITGTNNVAIGYGALQQNTSDNNVAIGMGAGLNNTTGSYNTFLGHYARNSNNYSYSTALGQNAMITGNNQVVLGTQNEYVYIPGTSSSTSTTTGALVVSGGAGITGNMYVGGNLYASTATSGTNTTQVATTAFVQNAISGISGNSGSSVSLSLPNTWTGVNTFNNTTASTSTTSGALVVSGGVGIAGDVYVGGNVYATTATSGTSSSQVATTQYVQTALSGYLSSTNTWSGTNSFSQNITVNGASLGYIATNNYKFGNNVLGNITTGGYNVGIGSNVLQYCTTGTDNIAIGHVALENCISGNYNTAVGSNSGQAITGSLNTLLGYRAGVSSGNYSYSTALGQNANITGNNQIVLGTTLEYVYIPGTSDASGSSIGAVVVSGGVAVGKGLYVNGNVTFSNVTKITNITTSTSTTSGALVVSGGVGISGNVNVGGNIILTNTTDASGSSIGALVVGGGVALAKGLYVGGNTILGNVTKITNTTASTSSVTGALVVSGGVGIAGDVYVGGNIYAPTATSGTNTTQVATTAFVQSAISGISGSSVSLTSTNTWTGVNTFSNTTASTSTTTGALKVSGGVGVAGNVYVGGNINTNGAILGYYGNNNYFFGSSCNSITTASNNVGIGGNIMTGVTSGAWNVAVCTDALSAITGGSANAAIGYQSLNALTTDSRNTAIGFHSGYGITGNNNTYIGCYTTNYNNNSYSYSTAVGQYAQITANHQVMLGTSSEYVYIPGSTVASSSTTGALIVVGGVGITGKCYASSFNTSSDYRIKENVIPLNDDFTVDNLNPVHYYNKLTNTNDIGFIAHEVQQEYPYLVSGEKDDTDYQSLNYTGIIGILVHEIKELKKENRIMKEELQNIKNVL